MRRLPVPLLALVVLASCGHENPTQPSRTTGVPKGVSAVSLAISPPNVTLTRPGETAQLAAVITYSDGTTRDVTSQAQWSPSVGEERVVTVKSGLMTAVGYGRTSFGATFIAVSAAEHVTATGTATVLPQGSYLLEGEVKEGGFALSSAAVRVTLPSGMEYDAVTNSDGKYQLPAAGLVTIQAEKSGYAQVTKQLLVDRDQVFNFDLRRPDDPGEVRGVYTLTMTASPLCKLPPQLSQRVYAARILDGPGGTLVVEVDGPDMEAWGGAGFTGTRDGNRLRFGIDDSYASDYVFIERVEPNMNLAYAGVATGILEGGRISAPFNGRIQYRTVQGTVQIECQAADHRLELVR